MIGSFISSKQMKVNLWRLYGLKQYDWPIKIIQESYRIWHTLVHSKTDADTYKITYMKKTGNDNWSSAQEVCVTSYPVMNFLFI